MPKEKSLNPVQAHNKSLKRAEHKKSKAAVQAQRQERLSKRDPSRLERQIASLQDLASEGTLKPRDKETLAALEKDLASVRKARERAGVPEPRRDRERGDREGNRDRRDLKRRRGDEDGSDTDPEVRDIPMPRDTPPPIPRRRPKDDRKPVDAPPAEAQITYSSAPVMRDLKKAATGAKFAPVAVKRNIERAKGKGGLVEEEEWERLEKAGYAGQQPGAGPARKSEETVSAAGPKTAAVEEVEDEDL
ncbi:hypothetical protein ANO11243_007830 [Dothideomycetidae sp. 11243]|nr:hypothetical protein ANO11243_007830 [fungal sp. No.11243]